MTIPSEEREALLEANKLLREFLDARQTPRVPKHIRRRALWILKHYPSARRIAAWYADGSPPQEKDEADGSTRPSPLE